MTLDQARVAEVAAVLREVFTSLVGVDITPTETAGPSPVGLDACIALREPAGTLVCLSCTPSFARMAAARMLDADPGSVGEDAVLDAWRELAAVVAGNLRGSLSAASAGADRARTGRELRFVGDGRELAVHIHDRPERGETCDCS